MLRLRKRNYVNLLLSIRFLIYHSLKSNRPDFKGLHTY